MQKPNSNWKRALKRFLTAGTSLWKGYRKQIVRNCTDDNTSATGIGYWRDQLFATTLLYLIPFSLVAVIPGVYMAYTTDLYVLLAADVIAMAGILIIAFGRGIPVYVRKLVFCFCLYLVAVALLYSLGSFGPGLLYLFAITVFIILIFEEKIAIGSVYMNITVCILFGFLIYYDMGGSPVTGEYDVNSWIAVSSNLVFLSGVAVLLIPRLFSGLEQAFNNRDQLEAELIQKQQDLEYSMELLEEKNRELEEFAYIASHDLKEPLRMVRSFVELLRNKYGRQMDERAQKYMHFAVDGAERMTRLIDDLLQYSRVGRLHTETESVDLNELVQDVILNYSTETGTTPIRFCKDHLPEITAVPVSMKMLFQNLISNAVKYQAGENTPEISITCTDLGDYWKFAVTDNGIGMDHKHHDEIFLLFKRLHSAQEYSGSGMGLAICKKVVTGHGGEIWVTSEKGKGSTFYFTIAKKQPVI